MCLGKRHDATHLVPVLAFPSRRLVRILAMTTATSRGVRAVLVAVVAAVAGAVTAPSAVARSGSACFVPALRINANKIHSCSDMDGRRERLLHVTPIRLRVRIRVGLSMQAKRDGEQQRAPAGMHVIARHDRPRVARCPVDAPIDASPEPVSKLL